jgi:hypothetical protein
LIFSFARYRGKWVLIRDMADIWWQSGLVVPSAQIALPARMAIFV